MMKQRIMEVLFSSSNNLTKQELEWAAANIPNETVNQPVVYDHDAQGVYEACGLGEDKTKSLISEYEKIKDETDLGKKSQVIEYILNNGSHDLIRAFFIRGVMDYEESKHKQITEKLKELLRKLED